MQRFDAIIAGGGVAGSTTAAAMAQQGLRPLLCEAGLPSDRRLAGELMHPPAAEDLDRVGLLEPLLDAGAVPVYGFAIFEDGAPRTVLSYSEIRGGRATSVAIEHSRMTRALLDAVTRRDGIEVWEGARVTDVDFGHAEPVASVKWGNETVQVQAPLVVSAEGRDSKIRKGAGMTAETGEPFRMVGWNISGGRLPYPGYGHIFIGDRTTTLAYQMGRDEVRIMFELEMDDPIDIDHLLAAIPSPFVEDVRRAISDGRRQTARVLGLNPNGVVRGRLVVVGDAGGCVHPLTATGIAFCTRDALALADHVADDFRDGAGVVEALSAYDDSRKRPMRARAALGPALVEALSSQEPGMRLLRHGLFRYWDRSTRGRAASLGLLSTEESRPSVMAREYARVCFHALSGLPRGVLTPRQVVPAIGMLVQRSATYFGQIVRP